MSTISPTGSYTPVPFTPTNKPQTLFEQMSSATDWVSPDAPEVFPNVSQTNYNFESWSQSDSNKYKQACTNAYDLLLQSESSAETQFSSPLGKESISQALDEGSCLTSNATGTTSAIWGAYKSGYQNSYSKGCSAIAVNAAMRLTMSNALTCTAIQSISDAQDDTDDEQIVNVLIEDSTFNNLNVGGNQGDTNTLQCLNYSSTKLQSSMEQSLKSNVKNLQSSMQKYTSKNTIQADPGQKSLQEFVNANIQSATQFDFSKVIASSIATIFVKQGTNYVLIGDTVKGTANINTSESIVQQTIVKAVVNNVVNELFKQSGSDQFMNNQTISQTEELSKTKAILETTVLVLSILNFFGCLYLQYAYRGGTLTNKIYFYVGVCITVLIFGLSIYSITEKKTGITISSLVITCINMVMMLYIGGKYVLKIPQNNLTQPLISQSNVKSNVSVQNQQGLRQQQSNLNSNNVSLQKQQGSRQQQSNGNSSNLGLQQQQRLRQQQSNVNSNNVSLQKQQGLRQQKSNVNSNNVRL